MIADRLYSIQRKPLTPTAQLLVPVANGWVPGLYSRGIPQATYLVGHKARVFEEIERVLDERDARGYIHRVEPRGMSVTIHELSRVMFGTRSERLRDLNWEVFVLSFERFIRIRYTDQKIPLPYKFM